MKDKFPLRIIAGNEQFKATTSIDSLKDKARNIHLELTYLENDYTSLINSIRSIVSASSQSKKIDPRLYWLLADNIIRFLQRIADMGFYLVQQNRTLARDIGISESSVKKIVSFRRRFPRISLVNCSISWNKYRDNKVAVPCGE
jgi:hypothetical protein